MLQEVTVAWERQRLLLFIIYLDDQGNDADDQNAELEQIGICDHVHHPPPVNTALAVTERAGGRGGPPLRRVRVAFV